MKDFVMKKMLLLFCSGLASISLFGAENVQEVIKQEITFEAVPVYRKISMPFQFNGNAVGKNDSVILSFQAKYRVRAGSPIKKYYYPGRPREILCLEMNGKPLTDENRIIPDRQIIRTNRTAYDVCNPYTNAWNLLDSETFDITPALQDSIPFANPFDYAVDVTDLLKNGENVFNAIPFPPAGGGQEYYTIDMRNIVLKTVPSSEVIGRNNSKAAIVPSGDLPVYVPASEPSGCKLAVDTFGGFSLTVNGEVWQVQSLWYWPNKGINILGMGKGATAEKQWQPQTVQVDANTYRISASGASYRLERTVKLLPDHIDITDDFTNLLDADTPIVGRTLVISSLPLEDIYAGGVLRISPEGTLGFEPQNPTVYLGGKKSGIGMMAREDIMRSSVSMFWNRKGAFPFAGFELWHHVLPPKGKCSLRWTIVPTEDNDYWRFVNTMRRTLDTNFTIPGLAVFVSTSHPLRKMTDEELRDYVKVRGIQFFLTDHYRKANAQKNSFGSFVQGADALNDSVAESIADFRLFVARIKKAVPDVKVLIYFHSALCSDPDAFTKYAGSRGLANGKGISSYAGMILLFPTLTNSYGKALDKVIDIATKKIGADGIYWDEMCTGYVGDADEWSGRHAKVSRSDFTAGERYSFTPHLMIPWKEQTVKRLFKENKYVIANTNPTTETMTRLHFPRFVEYNNYDSCAQGQLYTPLTVTQAERCNSSANILKQVREYLDHGSLTYEMAPYNQGPAASVGIKTDNILSNMYPFTPVYIRPGVMIGKERILFSVPGKFGWGDGKMPSQVKIFDENGKPVDGSGWIRPLPAEGVTEVRLPGKYTGVLIK